MSTSSEYNILRLEAPRGLLQITNDEETQEETLEIANPVRWMRAMANHQQQAEQDLRQLIDVCGNTLDHTDRRIRWIEAAYNRLAQGAQYVYEQMEAKEQISGDLVRNELMVSTNAYQAFTRQVWEAIIEYSKMSDLHRVHEATQVARMHNAVAFLSEANLARNVHLMEFQGNVEKWAADHQWKVETLEQQRSEDRDRMTILEQRLAQAQDELLRVATTVPLPTTPAGRARPTQSPGAPPTRLVLGSPLLGGNPKRRQRPPAVPAAEPSQRPHGTGGAGRGGSPPRPPRRGALPSPSPPPSESDNDLYERNLPTGRPLPVTREPTQSQLATMLTPGEIAQLVGAGIAAARATGQPTGEARIHTSRLKMENPEKFDGKSSSTFNQWWESVTMYLRFYPETVDRQKIALVGTLLTDTALVWNLHRYRELGENDTWINYNAAIRAEYRNEREAADPQLKLGQLKYQGSIRAYLTELRALNNFAQATSEALREKVDLAIPDAILDMRFAHYLEDIADDEGFLQATHQAGLQVEKKKALKQAREQTRGTSPSGTSGKNDEQRREGQDKRNPDGNKRGKETDKPRQEKTGPQPDRCPWWGGKDHWASRDEAMKGVPAKEQEEYGQ